MGQGGQGEEPVREGVGQPEGGMGDMEQRGH